MSLPKFNSINPTTINDDLTALLENNKATINTLTEQDTFTWDNLIRPIENLDDKLTHFWSPISHLHSVKDNAELRQAYQQALAPLTQYSSELAHNKALFQAIESIANSAGFADLDKAQRKTIENNLRNFKLAGVNLNDADKKIFTQLSTELSELTTRFANNVLDATQAWHYHTDDKNNLTGLPEYALDAAMAAAKQKGLTGYVFTLDAPSFIAVMTYADNRSLRETMYRAYTSRASDRGPNAGKFDNSNIMQDILKRRLQLAQLLGFNSYADYSLATKMVDDCEQVINFLEHLAKHAYPKAKQEMLELSEFAQQLDGTEQLEAWDTAYYSEKHKQSLFDISDDMLRPYFQVDHVLNGLFTIANKLYDIRIEAIDDVETWHQDVRVYELYDHHDTLIAMFYVDLYARQNKRGGAWMDECQIRRLKDDGHIQIPIAYLTCNFQAPVAGKPALMTHNDVVTLFHEFGHCLQHMLTKVNYADVSGINGVAWDAVELPSQFMENWAWQKQGLDLISCHIDSGKTLPEDLLQRMLEAKNYHSAMQTVRQLEFALFDFRLHMAFDPQVDNQIQTILDQVRATVSVTPACRDNRFQHGFSHIFAGGYAAGYYSYKWAEVMAADAFSLFLEQGIFNRDAATRFKECILETGGSEDALVLFERFRGHAPDVSALLKQDGITA